MGRLCFPQILGRFKSETLSISVASNMLHSFGDLRVQHWVNTMRHHPTMSNDVASSKINPVPPGAVAVWTI